MGKQFTVTPSPWSLRIARLVATCASLVFAAACDGRSSPTAAGGPLQLRIEGMVTDEGPQFIGFELESPFTEELPGFRYLNIMGGAPTSEPVTVSGSAVSIPFFAQFQYCELNAPARRGWENCQHAETGRFHACVTDSARMVLTRR